ncbi:LOW QUALITY PROTEIN: reverse transcriptase [Phytophthora megakarya]|uniref:Reverse transcriptase n=1 Tax=Phytophthora megakarya TaxID=4795 RepID=A0A225VBX9_9STRA|nr:LOW QUALITY PROTEIN: reverse transcriptase [Phytophthora megakarya]
MNPDSSFQQRSGTIFYVTVTKITKEVIKASPGPIRGYVQNSIGLADVEHFVKECVDCASGKGKPPNAGPTPENIEPRQPFEVVSIDFVTHMPKSDRGNTFLLLLQDMFSGYVMYKPMDSTIAQDVAEAYEERVFRNFGANSMIRHDQGPQFMSDVFTRFRELLNSRQIATLGYRPQANGQHERSV